MHRTAITPSIMWQRSDRCQFVTCCNTSQIRRCALLNTVFDFLFSLTKSNRQIRLLLLRSPSRMDRMNDSELRISREFFQILEMAKKECEKNKGIIEQLKTEKRVKELQETLEKHQRELVTKMVELKLQEERE